MPCILFSAYQAANKRNMTRTCKNIMRFLAIMSAIFLLAVIASMATPLRIELACSRQLWYTSLDIAVSQNGVREKTGRNDGVMIERYLASVGLGKGHPYCQAAQYWTFVQAANKLGLPTSSIPIARTASTRTAWQQARRNGVIVPTKPKRGDLITWAVSRTYKGHVERVVSVRTGGWVQTIGFNTSSGKRGSQRDGGGVHLRYRNWISPDMRMLVIGFTGRYTMKERSR